MQQLTCKIDSSNYFYYLFLSFIILELKPFVLKGKVLGEKFWKSAKKCENVKNYETILSFSCCPLVFPWQELENISVHPVHRNPRTGLLRTFWERDRVLRSPLRGLCVQGACPKLPYKKSVSVHPVHGNPRTDLLRTLWKPHRVLRSPFLGLCLRGAQNDPSKEGLCKFPCRFLFPPPPHLPLYTSPYPGPTLGIHKRIRSRPWQTTLQLVHRPYSSDDVGLLLMFMNRVKRSFCNSDRLPFLFWTPGMICDLLN